MRYPKDPSAPLHLTINCRCIMVGAKKKGDNLSDITNEELTSITASATPDTPTDSGNGTDPMPWVGVLALEGHPTGDGRTLAADSLTWNTPVPLRWVKQDTGEHNGAVVVGKILTIDRVPHPTAEDVNIIKASGVFAETSEGFEAQHQVAEELAQGVSVDLDDMQFTFAEDTEQNDNAPRDVTITKARIRAATLVAIPAFAEAKLQVLTDTTSDSDDETDEEKDTFDAIAETWENSGTDQTDSDDLQLG